MTAFGVGEACAMNARPSSADDTAPPPIALYMPDLSDGGMERVMLNLAEAFLARGHAVDLLVSRADGIYRDHLPEGVRLLVLEPAGPLLGRLQALRATRPAEWKTLAWTVLLGRKPGRQLFRLPSLVRYLRARRPGALIAANTYCNLNAVWARRLAGVPTRVMVTEHNALSPKNTRTGIGGAQWLARLPLIGQVYARADVVLAVSDGVADDLSAVTGLARSRIATVYNPVIKSDLAARAGEAAPHPWLADGGAAPVIVATGRLAPQKNFPLLLQAFALLRRQRPARLLILGEGRLRPQLEALIAELGLGEDVALPGFVTNPYAAFARASLFVLSSDYEGLGNVLIEAMACGCPVVSTDCPSGPAEILEGGRLGELVPVKDAVALSAAMLRALDTPRANADALRRRGAYFSQERSAERYLDLLFGQRRAPSELAACQPPGEALSPSP